MALVAPWLWGTIDELQVSRTKMTLMGVKYEIIKAKDTTEELKPIIGELNIKISDKMYQMDKANFGKDKEINSLIIRADKMSEQNNKLESDPKQGKEKYEQQDERIKKLEWELSEVKNALEVIRIANEEQVSLYELDLK